jgi:hypothetical protein
MIAAFMRGYCSDERIVYGTGQIVPTDDIAAEAGALLDRPGIAFVDVRSASNNCFQCRIVPARGAPHRDTLRTRRLRS